MNLCRSLREISVDLHKYRKIFLGLFIVTRVGSGHHYFPETSLATLYNTASDTLVHYQCRELSKLTMYNVTEHCEQHYCAHNAIGAMSNANQMIQESIVSKGAKAILWLGKSTCLRPMQTPTDDVSHVAYEPRFEYRG